MRKSALGWLVALTAIAVGCSSSTVVNGGGSSGSGGVAGNGGGAAGGGTSGSGGTAGSGGGTAGSAGTAGSSSGGAAGSAGSSGGGTAGSGGGGTAGSAGSDAGVDASSGGTGGTAGSAGSDAGVDASSGGTGGADASAGGSAGSDAGAEASAGGSGGSGGAGIDAGGACLNGITGGDGTVSYPLWPIATEDYRQDPEFTTTTNTVIDHATCLMWQRSVMSGTYSWDAAKAACAGLTLDGYNDWRLPTRAELISITNFTGYAPALDKNVFSDTPTSGNAAQFWASTVLAGGTTKHWVDALGTAGQITYQTSTGAYGVRCVRGTGAPTTPRFDSSTAGVVIDNYTGLEWEADPPDQEYAQGADAAAYCQNLVLAGKSDWRVPDAREISTLLDPANATNLLPSSFKYHFGAYYWSSTYLSGYGYWCTYYGNGYTVACPTTATVHRVRCVR